MTLAEAITKFSIEVLQLDETKKIVQKWLQPLLNY